MSALCASRNAIISSSRNPRSIFQFTTRIRSGGQNVHRGTAKLPERTSLIAVSTLRQQPLPASQRQIGWQTREFSRVSSLQPRFLKRGVHDVIEVIDPQLSGTENSDIRDGVVRSC